MISNYAKKLKSSSPRVFGKKALTQNSRNFKKNIFPNEIAERQKL